MADPEHIQLLRQGVEVWNALVADNPWFGPDLSGANFAGANLRGANLSGTNLSRANLSGANLSEADLSSANLREADFHRADLCRTDLRGADLMGADLSGAKLVDANLRGAILSGAALIGARLNRADLCQTDLRNADLCAAHLVRADLSGANLMTATLLRADLNGAKLHGAGFGGTMFADTRLTDVQGLDACEHSGPSTIDYLTLAKSGRLPPAFLRGCGLPDELIDYLQSLLNEPIQFYSCFISYSHADRDFARRLYDRLQGSGIRCWLDEKQLRFGDDIHEEVDRGIRLWDKVLLCCSQTSLTSWWVDNEIGKAFAKEQALWDERKEKVFALISLDLDGHLLGGKWASGKATRVLERVVGDFQGWEGSQSKFEKQVQGVIDALRIGREPPPVPRI